MIGLNRGLKILHAKLFSSKRNQKLVRSSTAPETEISVLHDSDASHDDVNTRALDGSWFHKLIQSLEAGVLDHDVRKLNQ